MLDNNAVLITYSSIIKLLKTTVNEVKGLVHPIPYWNSKKKWNNGLYLKEIPEILSSIISGNESDSLKVKAKELLQELSHIALKQLTGEKDIIPDTTKQEPSFDQLLGALMKVPPQKNKKIKSIELFIVKEIMVQLLLIWYYSLYLKFKGETIIMPNTVIENRVSLNAIRKANEKQRSRKYIASPSTSQNGEINVSFSNGLFTKQIIITREQISSAYHKALQENGKKI